LRGNAKRSSCSPGGRSIPDLDPALRASHGDESVIEEISRGLESTNSRERNYAARELQLLNNPLAVDALGVCLVKHNSDSALSALRSIGDIRAAEYLYTALNVDDAWWRPQQEGINAGLVGGTDGEVAYETVYPYKKKIFPALKELGGRKLVIGTFVRLVGDPESRRRDAAADALLRIARDPFYRPDRNSPDWNMMIDAVNNLLRENAIPKATASSILGWLR
jgi:hypothetical protein